MVVERPRSLFDRTVEWADLDRFLAGPGGRLAVVWGPRRVGKSFLLESLCDASGGFYVQALRQDPVPFLAAVGRMLADRVGAPAPLRLDDWTVAITAMLDLPDTPLVVLDEFPYLVESSPAVPTVVQALVDRRRPGRARLVLCGSAVSQMTRMLAMDGPLYRRATLSLPVRPFDLRTTAQFWGLTTRPEDAIAVHAVVGGTPGYHDVLAPVGDDVDRWIRERVLDPTTTLFHEDELVLAEDPSLPDSNVYRSILAAIVAGERTVTGVARMTGRKATSLVRPIERLIEAGLVYRTADPLRSKRSLLGIGDPFLRFHYAIIRPNQAPLLRRRGRQVWDRSRETFASQVVGPHFEQLCREAVMDHELGLPAVSAVGVTTLRDPVSGLIHEVDVVGTDERGRIVLLGEAKSSKTKRTTDDLSRLERLRSLVPADRAAGSIHLAIFSVGGANRRLAQLVTGRRDVSLIDAADLVGSAI